MMVLNKWWLQLILGSSITPVAIWSQSGYLTIDSHLWLVAMPKNHVIIISDLLCQLPQKVNGELTGKVASVHLLLVPLCLCITGHLYTSSSLLSLCHTFLVALHNSAHSCTHFPILASLPSHIHAFLRILPWALPRLFPTLMYPLQPSPWHPLACPCNLLHLAATTYLPTDLFVSHLRLVTFFQISHWVGWEASRNLHHLMMVGLG